MRPKLSKVTWKSIHISIDIDEGIESIASSSKKGITREEFLDKVINSLQEHGYIPRLPVDKMKELLKSPFSESEYYTFLKIEDNQRIKVVLDIRLSEHRLTEWGRHSAVDRHKHYMETELIPQLAEERQLDGTAAQPEMIGVTEIKAPLFDLIYIDDELFNNYSEALAEMETKIDSLP